MEILKYSLKYEDLGSVYFLEFRIVLSELNNLEENVKKCIDFLVGKVKFENSCLDCFVVWSL